MIAEPPNVPDSGRYSKAEAAKILGVSTKTIDRHTLKGNLHCGIRRYNKRRFYTGRELKRFWIAEF